MDLIQKLEKCDLGGEVYHSDGKGHLQVQLVSPNGFETPAFLLEQVEKEGLWSEFFKMTKTKDDEWIMRITRFFSNTEHYSTECFVELLTILSSRDAQIQLIQDAPLWLWNKNNTNLINIVTDKAKQLIDSTVGESLDKEIDLSILNRVINKLEAKRKTAD